MGTSMEEMQDAIARLQNKMESISSQSDKPSALGIVTIIISVCALSVSFSSTLVSDRNSNKQEFHRQKAELWGMLQRTVALQKENAELYRKYNGDGNTIAQMSGFLNQENLLLAKQASEIMNSLPKETLTASDYNSVGVALANSRNVKDAIFYYNEALRVATILDDEVWSLRALAEIQGMSGDIDGARSYFQKAQDIIDKKYSAYDKHAKNMTRFITEINWIRIEALNKNTNEVELHIVKAEQCIELAPPTFAKIFKEQLDSVKKEVRPPQQGTSAPPGNLPNASAISAPIATRH